MCEFSTSGIWAGGKESGIHRPDLFHAVAGMQERIDQLADAGWTLGRSENGGVVFFLRRVMVRIVKTANGGFFR
jgi:hypothetical protein